MAKTLDVASTNDSVYSALAGVLVHHRPADSEVTGLERKSTVHCKYAWKRIPLLWELGSATSGPASYERKQSRRTTHADLFQLTYRLKVVQATSGVLTRKDTRYWRQLNELA